MAGPGAGGQLAAGAAGKPALGLPSLCRSRGPGREPGDPGLPGRRAWTPLLGGRPGSSRRSAMVATLLWADPGSGRQHAGCGGPPGHGHRLCRACGLQEPPHCLAPFGPSQTSRRPSGRSSTARGGDHNGHLPRRRIGPAPRASPARNGGEGSLPLSVPASGSAPCGRLPRRLDRGGCGASAPPRLPSLTRRTSGHHGLVLFLYRHTSHRSNSFSDINTSQHAHGRGSAMSSPSQPATSRGTAP